MALRYTPTRCPDWEYKKISGWRGTVVPRVEALMDELSRQALDAAKYIPDTRPKHEFLFAGLTGACHAHLAGHYRGAELDCLLGRPVFVSGFAGTLPHLVEATLGRFAKTVLDGIAELDGKWAAIQAGKEDLTAADFYRWVAYLAAEMVAEFYRIHPYANGNGHIGRHMVWAVMSRYGKLPKRFTIEPRPDPERFRRALKLADQGQIDELVCMILDACDWSDSN